MGLIRIPSLVLWPVRLLAWFLWRSPVSKREDRPQRPKKPKRRQVICFTVAPMPRGMVAILRVCWYENGKAARVQQIPVMDDGSAEDAFRYYMNRALSSGADIQVMTERQPEELGVRV